MIRTSSGRLVSPGLLLLKVLKNTIAASTATSIETIAPKRNLNTIQHKSASPSNDIATDKYATYSPEEGFVRQSPYEQFTPTDLTVDKYVWENMHKWQDRIAAICVSTGRQYTYAQLRDRCASFALSLQKILKMSPRDILAVVLPNVPEFPIVTLGASEAGVIVTSVNPVYTADEIARQLLNSQAKVVIGTVAGYPILKEACKIAQKNLPIICIRVNNNEHLPNDAIDFFQLCDIVNVDYSQLRQTDVNKEDVAFLPYSSGTTGMPKGVMLTHRNITSNSQMMGTFGPFEPLMVETTADYQEVSPSLLPFFHIYGFSVNLISRLRVGAKLVTMVKFTPEDLIKSLYDHKGTILNLVPPIVLFLTNSPKVERKHVESLKVVMCGAAPIGALDVERLIAKYSHLDFVQGYGMTETSPVVMVGHKGLKKYSAVGFASSGTEIKIVPLDDPQGLGVGPHTTGEVWSRGPQNMLGYLNNEQANREIFAGNGWLRTGDVGYHDDDGYFFITDRIKELIKVKGFQVPPAELEELLRDHPAILDAAVVGSPHPTLGEAPRAFVVLRPGQKASGKEIQDYIAEKVANYKKLEGGVTFLNEIPKNVSGKILRRELKLQHCN